MVQIWFPGLTIPELALPPHTLADFWLLGMHVVIGWGKVTIIPATKIWDGFLILDTDWIVQALSGALAAIPKAVWDFAKGTMDAWAATFYEKHCTYEEYVKEREAKHD